MKAKIFGKSTISLTGMGQRMTDFTQVNHDARFVLGYD